MPLKSGTHWRGERGVYPEGGVSTFSDSLVCLLMLEEQELKKIFYPTANCMVCEHLKTFPLML